MGAKLSWEFNLEKKDIGLSAIFVKVRTRSCCRPSSL
jgi:hypothetical protein